MQNVKIKNRFLTRDLKTKFPVLFDKAKAAWWEEIIGMDLYPIKWYKPDLVFGTMVECVKIENTEMRKQAVEELKEFMKGLKQDADNEW
jgi:hypothetical protein